MAVVSLLLALIYSVWSATINVTGTGVSVVQDVQRERMAIKAITDALGGATWYENRTEPQLQLDAEDGFSRLALISRVPPGFWGERVLGGHPLRRIEFRAEPKQPEGYQLVMLQQMLLSATNSTEFHRTILLPHVSTFALEVKSPGTNTAWNGAWPIAQSNALPRQARLTLATSEANPQQRTIPLFASAAIHTPAFPVIGRVVRTAEASFGEDGFDVDESDATGRLVFIIDKSWSMNGSRLQMAKDALMQTLGQMEEGQKFYVYFFNGKTDALPSAMLDATPDNIARVKDWIQTQKVGPNDKGIMDALKGAFSHEPTEVYLLTDGAAFAPDFRSLITQLNTEKKVKVNTHGVGERIFGQEGETTLMLIAKENGGTYTAILPVSKKK